jgi:hypothetical protein
MNASNRAMALDANGHDFEKVSAKITMSQHVVQKKYGG